MVVIVPSEWVARAEEEAPGYGMTTWELLGVWSRYPSWGPGGRYYKSSDRLPSSQPDGTIEVYCQEPPMKLDPVNVVVWSLVWGSALGALVVYAWLLRHAYLLLAGL